MSGVSHSQGIVLEMMMNVSYHLYFVFVFFEVYWIFCRYEIGLKINANNEVAPSKIETERFFEQLQFYWCISNMKILAPGHDFQSLCIVGGGS